MQQVADKIVRKNRLTLVLLILAFLVPVVVAWLMLQSMENAEQGKTKNYGDLVNPPRPLQEIQLQRLAGGAFTGEDLRGKWTLVYFHGGDCDAQCADVISRMKQVRLAQGANMARVQRLYVMLDDVAQESLRTQMQNYPGLIVVSGSATEQASFAGQFASESTAQAEKLNQVYLVDPLGNLMMRYPVDFKLIHLIKDLEHLLKYSQIG